MNSLIIANKTQEGKMLSSVKQYGIHVPENASNHQSRLKLPHNQQMQQAIKQNNKRITVIS